MREWGQRAVISSLVANVATAYFELHALDSELDISKRTFASRQQPLFQCSFRWKHR
jgi:multidrug efflux system outer membrane protein